MITYETFRNHTYEEDTERFPEDTRYRIPGLGAAWFILGWEVEADEDTEWSGYYNRTRNVLAVMVGDDGVHSMDADDLQPIEHHEYCSGCGQIGCQAEAGGL